MQKQSMQFEFLRLVYLKCHLGVINNILVFYLIFKCNLLLCTA